LSKHDGEIKSWKLLTTVVSEKSPGKCRVNMSFDVFLVAFRNGAKAAADAVAARAVLERFKYQYQPEFQKYEVNFTDGSSVEMYVNGLEGGEEEFDGGMLALHGISDGVGAFIFEFARSGGCVIFPAMEPACVLLPREDLAAHLPDDLGHDFQRIPVTSGAEVLAALKGGYDAWRAYRDKIVGMPGGKPATEAER
jgi:hypothetical protein